MHEGLAAELDSTRRFFLKTLEAFSEDDTSFAPQPEMHSVAAHVAHTAHTVDWFMEGAFGQGWDMDFETHAAHTQQASSLQKALDHLDRAFENAKQTVREASTDELMETIPDPAIMEGAPRMAIVNAITDHTAHHRGSLAVYARLLDRVPPMPYG